MRKDFDTNTDDQVSATGRRLGDYGDATLDLLDRLWRRGVRHAVVLMRHAAREFDPELHDLENPLTPDGRARALEMGARLPRDATLRGYASPPERCMETAALVLEGHRHQGGNVTRHRPLEALGVFYALDQRKMWQAMHQAGGVVEYVTDWVRGDVPRDAMIPAETAARLVLGIMAEKLRRPVGDAQIDLCVSHDMTLYLMREVLLGEPAAGAEVAFLDALVLYESDGTLWMTSHHGEPRRLQLR